MPYKTYCFAFPKRRFYTVKAAVLHCKRASFATSKRSYHFLRKLSLQKQWSYLVTAFGNTKKIVLLLKLCQSSFMPPFSYIHPRIKRI